MKTIEYNDQDFARFILDTVRSVKYHPSDGLYDIYLIGKMHDKVVDKNREARRNHEDYPDIEKRMFLSVSDYGTHSFDLDDPDSGIYIENVLSDKCDSSRFFLIKLYFNNLFKIHEPYAIVTEYSQEELYKIIKLLPELTKEN